MADIVMDGFSKRDVSVDLLIEQQLELAREQGWELTEEQAFEEVIADAQTGVVEDGRVAELLQALEAKDKSLGAKVRQFFQDVLQMIRDIVDAYRGVDPESMEGLMISKMDDLREQLQEALAEGIYSAGQNYQKAEKIPPAMVG